MNIPFPEHIPLISVLIRTTGRPQLRQALASVAAQDHPRVEVLLADVPGTGELQPPEGSPAARVVGTGAPLGRSAAANLLLREARGQMLLFLDDDDWLAPGHLTRLAAALRAEPHAVAAYAGVSCVEESADGTQNEVRVYDDAFDADRLLVENFIPIHAALLNRAAFGDSLPEFDEGLDVFEDWDFWLKCAQAGPFVHVPGVSAWYRIHEAGLGVRMEEAKAVQALDAVLARWAPKWTPEQRRALVALGRNVFRMRPHLEQLSSENMALGREKTLLRQQLTTVGAAYEQEIAEEAERHRHAMDELRRLAQAQLDEEAARGRAALEAMRASYESSRSWRITRPLRAAAGAARDVRGWLRGWLRGQRARASAGLLRLGLAAYKAPLLRPAFALVPTALKRNVHRSLMVNSLAAAEPVPPPVDASLVSIVVPVYNHAQFLERCLRSALDQDWPGIEVIVVDDASPDPEVRAILARLEGHARLRILHHATNRGISEAQNTALEHARGGAIAFLDCDDYLAPNAISTCMAAWTEDTVYLHTGRVNVDEADREVNRIHFVSLPRADYFAENLEAMYATHLKVIRRDVFARIGLFDPRFDSAQDYDMLMRIAFHYPSSAFVHVPDFVYFHRLHEGQATQQRADRQARMTATIQREARLRHGIREGRYPRKLSFVMLSYGKHSQTLHALRGLERTVRVPHEIILYDNGSSAETVAFLRDHIEGRFEGLKVVYGDRNLGPAQGRARALEHASGEWTIVFDNDEWPEEGWLEELLVRAESMPDVGAVCCRVAFPDRRLQFSGGSVQQRDDGTIELSLHDRGASVDDLRGCRFREVEWCPIGATLFTTDIRPFLHEGYPNVFEDAGVSFALKKLGKRLLNSPASLVWHDHVNYLPRVEMQEKYMKDRYDARRMLTSLASFYAENGLLIYDEYIWRENGLNGLPQDEVLARLEETECVL